MGDTLKGIPELFETTLGESLVARTDQIPQFRYFYFASTLLKVALVNQCDSQENQFDVILT
jgi:hypothetical protein